MQLSPTRYFSKMSGSVRFSQRGVWHGPSTWRSGWRPLWGQSQSTETKSYCCSSGAQYSKTPSTPKPYMDAQTLNCNISSNQKRSHPAARSSGAHSKTLKTHLLEFVFVFTQNKAILQLFWCPLEPPKFSPFRGFTLFWGQNASSSSVVVVAKQRLHLQF